MPGRSRPVDVEHIKWEMARRGWEQADLAALLGMSEPGISRVLKGSTTQKTLNAIYAAFQANEPLEGMDALLAKKGE